MRKIYLTAGHRGGNTGVNVNGFQEAEETIWLRDQIAERLKKKGVQVFTDENEAQLNDVVKAINKTCEITDICADLHFNAVANPSANGTEVFKPFNYSMTEIELAEDLLYATTYILETKNRGVKREGEGSHKRLAMLSNIKCNSVLVEVCFASNRADLDKYLARKNELVIMYAEVLLRHANL